MAKLPKKITDLSDDFDEQSKLEELSLSIKKLEEDVSGLKHKLLNPSTTDGTSSALAICEQQIAILRHTSQIGELSLEEVKRLDLLVKNLTILKGDSIDVSPQEELPTENLLQIVGQNEPN